jgi:hypothetical protein
MKEIIKITFVIIISLSLFSCDKNSKKVNDSDVNVFEKSVAIIQYGLKDTKAEKQPLVNAVISFNPEYELISQYYIDGIQFTDDGDFNDEIAGDGLYTSIQEFSMAKTSDNSSYTINLNPDFKYSEELDSYLKKMNANNKSWVIGIGCDISLVECSETDWWNTCWPLDSPCTCVEFTNCNAYVEYEF